MNQYFHMNYKESSETHLQYAGDIYADNALANIVILRVPSLLKIDSNSFLLGDLAKELLCEEVIRAIEYQPTALFEIEQLNIDEVYNNAALAVIDSALFSQDIFSQEDYVEIATQIYSRILDNRLYGDSDKFDYRVKSVVGDIVILARTDVYEAMHQFAIINEEV